MRYLANLLNTLSFGLICTHWTSVWRDNSVVTWCSSVCVVRTESIGDGDDDDDMRTVVCNKPIERMWRTENREQRTENREQRTENRSLFFVCVPPKDRFPLLVLVERVNTNTRQTYLWKQTDLATETPERTSIEWRHLDALVLVNGGSCCVVVLVCVWFGCVCVCSW